MTDRSFAEPSRADPAAVGVVLCAVLLVGCTQTSPGSCTADSQCTAPSRCCSGKCVDVQTSVAHCGACFTMCGAQNGAAKCTAGTCAISCSTGFGDCNKMLSDGCEVDLASSLTHCGSCGSACMSSHATNVCERSQCLQSSCNPGFGDCNASELDGCETDLKSSLVHCGSCGKKCEVLQGVGTCSQSTCTVASCNAGFGDCDVNAVTGCETDLTGSDAHCGTCATSCDPGFHCKSSKCVAPELLFYGGIINIMSPLATDVVSAFNVETHTWSALATTGIQTPGGRFAHAAVWDAVGKQMLVWGGVLSGNTLADAFVWSLDFGEGDGGVQPTWKKLVTTGGPTVSRAEMGWAWDKVGRVLYIYGGTDPASNMAYDELWQLDVAALTWTQRTEAGSPGGRYLHAMVWDARKQRILLGMGVDQTSMGPVSTFFTFDPAADGGGWSPFVATGAPGARAGAIFLGEAQPFHLWGGFESMGTISTELNRLDEADGGAQWTPLMPAGDTAIGGRAYALAASAGDRRFVFGGFALQGGFNPVSFSDVWEISEDAGWTKLADGGINFVHPGTVFASGVARE